jgi:hypothetical protein
LQGLVSNVDQALGQLAKERFDSASTLSNQFERSEIRLLAQLSIVQAVLAGMENNATRYIPRVMTDRRVVSIP